MLKQNYKFLVRLDWNINTTHKLTLKYSEMVGDDDRLMSNSVPNGGNSGGPNTWTANAVSVPMPCRLPTPNTFPRPGTHRRRGTER